MSAAMRACFCAAVPIPAHTHTRCRPTANPAAALVPSTCCEHQRGRWHRAEQQWCAIQPPHQQKVKPSLSQTPARCQTTRLRRGCHCNQRHHQHVCIRCSAYHRLSFLHHVRVAAQRGLPTSKHKSPHTQPAMELSPPTQAEAMERFIASEDLQQLEKPLLFERDLAQFKKLLCCQAAISTCLTYGLVVPCLPIASCCPFKLAKEFSLRLDQDAVTYSAATNDCCCHIAKTLKTVPLEKVQDVELQSNCLLSCFGLKAVNVQTAGMAGPGAEVSAAFLKDPERVREALRLAVKLYRQQQQGGGGGAGGYAGPRMPVAAWAEVKQVPAEQGGKGRKQGHSLAQRLQELEGLVTRGVLARAEADALKVCVLAAPDESWLSRLGEAADLRDGGLISAAEFEQLKASLVTQLREQRHELSGCVCGVGATM